MPNKHYPSRQALSSSRSIFAVNASNIVEIGSCDFHRTDRYAARIHDGVVHHPEISLPALLCMVHLAALVSFRILGRTWALNFVSSMMLPPCIIRFVLSIQRSSASKNSLPIPSSPSAGTGSAEMYWQLGRSDREGVYPMNLSMA